MKFAICLFLLFAAFTPQSAGAAVSVIVSPASASVAANGSQQFSAQVFGSADQTVRWEVNGVPGGAPSIGVISDAGLYTAPPDAAKALSVIVEAEPEAAPADWGSASVAVAPGPGPGPAYYVATTGANSAPGTKAKPFRTLQHAVDVVPAGAEILVESGVYNELVTFTRSGSAAAGFLTLRAAPSAHPIIDGTGLGVPHGENGLVTINNASWVRVEGFELRNYVSDSPALDPVGIYVVGAGEHIEILNNHIHGIATKVTTFAGDALGIAVYGTTAPASLSWVTIDGNTLDHLVTGYSESLALDGNVEIWEVTNNLIHDNDNIGVDVTGFYGTSPDPAYDQARRGLVSGNVVYDITSLHNPAYGGSLGADAIYVDGGTLVTIQDNVAHDSDFGIEISSENQGRAATWIWAHDNVVHHNKLAGITVGGATATANGGANDCFIANNTLYHDDTTRSGSGEFQVQFHAGSNVFVDNVVFASAQGVLINAFDKTQAPGSLDHNLYFDKSGASVSQWTWLNENYSSLGAFQSASHQDAQSRFANPRFSAPGNDDFSISSSSPAVALGEIVGLSINGLLDFAGRPRTPSATIDAGALQH